MKKMIFCLTAFIIAVVVLGCVSCNVTRVVSNESKYYQKGDTAITITTKTTETYDATKKAAVY